MTPRRLCLALAVGSIVSSMPAAAAFVSGVRVPAEFRSIKVKDAEGNETTVSQTFVPVIVTLSPAKSCDLVVAGGGAASSLDPGGDSDSNSLNGPADVTGQLFLRLLDNRLLLQGGVNVPTGVRELDAEELQVSEALAHPLLGFRLKTYGLGFDASGGAAVALPLGASASLGLGGGFVSHGKFTLQEAGDDYRPGSEGALNVGLDVGSGEVRSADQARTAAPLRVDVAYRFFGDDELADTAVFHEGNQLEAQALLQGGGPGLRGHLLGRLVSKEDNEPLTEDGDVLEDLVYSPGRLLQGRAGIEFPVSRNTHLSLQGEARSFDGSDLTAQDGTLFGGGAGLSFGIGSSGYFKLGGTYLTGSLDGASDPEDTEEAEDLDLTGFVVTASLAWRAR